MKNKEANFQILKIAAMLMIVSHHLVAKNAFNIDTQVIGITGNKLALQILGKMCIRDRVCTYRAADETTGEGEAATTVPAGYSVVKGAAPETNSVA